MFFLKFLFQKKIKYNLIENLPNLYLCPASEQIGHTWANGTVWDKPLIHKFYSLLKERSEFFTVFDIGAQTGSFSLMAKYFPNSKWYSFDPLQEAINALKINLSLNRIHNVSTYPVAVSDALGNATLKLPTMNSWGLSTLGSNVLRFTPVCERNIKCIDLDTFASENQVKKIDFIKIDTEGWELNVLKGAKKTILRDSPIILMEYNEQNMQQCNIKKDEIDEFLKTIGYTSEAVSHDDILCTPKTLL